jgi:hypothetical protein
MGLTMPISTAASKPSGGTGPTTETIGNLLPHLFQHQVHHRGQAHVQLQHAGSTRRNSTISFSNTVVCRQPGNTRASADRRGGTMTAYAYTEQPFVRPPELDGGTTDAPVAIVGAGPIGLAMAIDLAQRGVASVVLDDNNVVSVGSRAICWAKRTLEIFDRLGVGERMLEKGTTWKVGRLSTATARSTPSTFCPKMATSTRPS